MIPSPLINSLTIGPLTIHFYGLIIGLGILAGYYLAQKRAPYYQLSTDILDKLLMISLPTSLIGARLYHVLLNSSFYLKNPQKAFAIWEGGIGIMGAILAAMLTIYIFSKKLQIKFFSITDLLSPSLAIGQAIGRWGNYVNQELFGSPTSLPWALYIKPEHRPEIWQNFETFHPTFLYESILNFINAAILLKIANKGNHHPGIISGIYLCNYGIIRIVMEMIRLDPDQHGYIFGFRTASLVSGLLLILGLVILYRSHISNTNKLT